MPQDHTFLNRNTYTQVVQAGTRSSTPFSGYQVSDTVIGVPETVTVSLASQYYYYYPITDLGSLVDPLGGGSWDAVTHTFTESAIATGTPSPATAILDRLVYQPPALPAGQGGTAVATVSVDGQADPNGPVYLQTVTPPAITGTVATQPVASGSTIRPFALTSVADSNFGYNASLVATIRVTDGGTLTDADGLLSGDGLSKTGTGTYTIASRYLYPLTSLVFTPTAPAPGATRSTAFELSVLDTSANLSADDKTTSVLVFGPDVRAPLVSGTWSGQTVGSSGTIKPFSGVTVSDTNPQPSDSVTITISGGGTLSGQGLSGGTNGVYTIAAGSPQAVTQTLAALVFAPPALDPGQTSNTIDIRLDVADGDKVTTDTTTLINEQAPRVAAGSGAHSTTTFQGGAGDYTIKYTGAMTATVTDSLPTRDGSVASINNEVLQFRDQPFFIESADNANIARLYSAGLGRLPDTQGLFGWEDIYQNNVSAAAKAQGVYVSLAETSGGYNSNLSIADGIIQSPEFTSKYGALTNADFVTQLYQNVLGRAPEAAGLNGWITAMTTGDATGQVYNRGMVLVGFAESPENIAKSATWLIDTSMAG